MHSVTDGPHDDANSRSYCDCVAVRSVTKTEKGEQRLKRCNYTRQQRWTGQVCSMYHRDTLVFRTDPSRRLWCTSRWRRRRRWRGRNPRGYGSAVTHRRCLHTAETYRALRSWAGSRPCWFARTTCWTTAVKVLVGQQFNHQSPINQSIYTALKNSKSY